MSGATTSYAMKTTVALPYAQAVATVSDALADHGFGVLCEIDVAATLKNKLDAEVRPYVILGACNPPLALRALEAEPDIGLLLPCNVVVYQDADGGSTVVAAIDPVVQLGVAGNPALEPLAKDVRGRLEAVLRRVATAG